MADQQTIAKVLVILTAAYPRQATTKETAMVYADLLADIPDGLLLVAAKHHAASSKWFPSIAELREAAGQIRARASGLPSPAEAMAEVMAQVAAVGYYGSPHFSSPLVRRALDALGGWRAFCASVEGMADRAHFLRIYGDLLQRREQADGLLPAVRAEVERLAGVGDRPRLGDG